jgi:hypothetical protein
MIGRQLVKWFIAGLFCVAFTLAVSNSAQAEATHGNDTLVMSTFLLEDGVEGLATLDSLTGELKVFVINPKTGKFTLGGKRNLLSDLKIERGKKVSLLMVSGVTKFAGAAGAGATFASGVLYVMDGNTGKFVAYSIAYPPGALAAAAEVAVEITPLDGNTARTIKLP